jgi:spoIIIJ-associated protein
MTDDPTQRGQVWLTTLLSHAGVDATVAIDRDRLAQEGSCWLVIDDTALSPEQIEHWVGDKGTGLDALQYLANTILNLGQPSDQQQAYTIELHGYRAQRQAELHAWATTIATQVQETGEPAEMAGLSSAERRQVHTFLKQEYAGLQTESVGREPDRRLVVRPA